MSEFNVKKEISQKKIKKVVEKFAGIKKRL